ncbi:glycosyl transferase [Solimonas terrae]|uniref:Glycosyl transferase n=1 Tax=Solimonas terrae TaxID=1396819 RepID=A0A6M2BVK6_9GAMM|nr:glycosyl transferase [Solimonas terrae]
MSPETVRVFVGCDPNDCDLEQMLVLEHSLRRHASLPVDIRWMQLSSNPDSPWYSDPARRAGWRTERWATPFSGFRWAIPAVCGYQGRAIYMDTDTIVLDDIAGLWRAPIDDGAIVLARRDKSFSRFCVSLWDCAAARAHLPAATQLRADPDAHGNCMKYFQRHPQLIGAIDPAYNNIDGEHQPIENIKILHYSDMGTQFSHAHAMPRLRAEGREHWFDGKLLPHPRRDLADLFERTYAEALAAGRKLDDYRNPTPFGAFAKKSERGHRGNRVTRPGLLARVGRFFGS